MTERLPQPSGEAEQPAENNGENGTSAPLKYNDEAGRLEMAEPDDVLEMTPDMEVQDDSPDNIDITVVTPDQSEEDPLKKFEKELAESGWILKDGTISNGVISGKLEINLREEFWKKGGILKDIKFADGIMTSRLLFSEELKALAIEMGKAKENGQSAEINDSDMGSYEDQLKELREAVESMGGEVAGDKELFTASQLAEKAAGNKNIIGRLLAKVKMSENRSYLAFKKKRAGLSVLGDEHALELTPTDINELFGDIKTIEQLEETEEAFSPSE